LSSGFQQSGGNGQKDPNANGLSRNDSGDELKLLRRINPTNETQGFLDVPALIKSDSRTGMLINSRPLIVNFDEEVSKMSLEKATRWAAQMLCICDVLLAEHVVHGEITICNLFVSGAGDLQLGNFHNSFYDASGVGDGDGSFALPKPYIPSDHNARGREVRRGGT